MNRFQKPQPIDHYTLLTSNGNEWFVEEEADGQRTIISSHQTQFGADLKWQAMSNIHYAGYLKKIVQAKIEHLNVSFPPDTERLIIGRLPNNRQRIVGPPYKTPRNYDGEH